MTTLLFTLSTVILLQNAMINREIKWDNAHIALFTLICTCNRIWVICSIGKPFHLNISSIEHLNLLKGVCSWRGFDPIDCFNCVSFRSVFKFYFINRIFFWTSCCKTFIFSSCDIDCDNWQFCNASKYSICY